MIDPLPQTFGDAVAAAEVLRALRSEGPQGALNVQNSLISSQPDLFNDLLQREITLRLSGETGPRIVVDGLWFSRSYGGISRVWDQIIKCWRLPGLITKSAPVCFIERETQGELLAEFSTFQGSSVDPLDPVAVSNLSEENAKIVRTLNAQVFISSWVSNSGKDIPACAELALVHDCLPERYDVKEPLKGLRRRWLMRASGFLAVSSDTASDLETLLNRPQESIPWCHPAPSELFMTSINDDKDKYLWSDLCINAGLSSPYILIPATSAVGSYKNPEIVAEALADPSLACLKLVLCGISADERRKELECKYSHLIGRCLAAGFSDTELALVYRHSLGVVIPSHIEGFGLPVIEALSSGATVLVADSRGLREAASSAALRFNSRDSQQLVELLKLLLHPITKNWLSLHLKKRTQDRLSSLQIDLLGLSILAQAREIAR